jgi:hypothetical protein
VGFTYPYQKVVDLMNPAAKVHVVRMTVIVAIATGPVVYNWASTSSGSSWLEAVASVLAALCSLGILALALEKRHNKKAAAARAR